MDNVLTSCICLIKSLFHLRTLKHTCAAQMNASQMFKLYECNVSDSEAKLILRLPIPLDIKAYTSFSSIDYILFHLLFTFISNSSLFLLRLGMGSVISGTHLLPAHT